MCTGCWTSHLQILPRLRGKALAQTGALDRAIADFDQALKWRPRNAEALAARGAIWMKKKDYARALADLDQSIESQPTISGYLVRGLVHETQGKCSLAMADYRQARELKAGGTLEVQAQAAAKSRLDQYARHKSCGPAGEHRLAGDDGSPLVVQDPGVAPTATADKVGLFRGTL
jgi:tetratricopeptide (TPR) repeat protein